MVSSIVSDANSWLIGKVRDARKDRVQKEKRAQKDEMAGWHHWCYGHELGQTLRDGEGQGGLSCCIPWGHKWLGITGWLNDEQMPGGVSVAVCAGKVDSGSAMLCPHPHLTRSAQFYLYYSLSFWIRRLWKKKKITMTIPIAFRVIATKRESWYKF